MGATLWRIRAAAACALMAASPGGAQTHAAGLRPAHADMLDRASSEHASQSNALRSQADAVAAEINQLREELVAAGAERTRQEHAAANARARLARLSQNEDAQRSALAREEAALAQVLGALQRASRADPPALATRPHDAADAARAALLLAHAGPALEARAVELRANIDALEGLQAALSDARATLQTAEAQLDLRRAETLALIQRKQTLERSLRDKAAREAAHAEELAQEARSVRELIAAWRARDLETAPRLKPAAPTLVAPAPATPPSTRGLRFAQARGALPPPAVGRVVRRFGTPGPSPHASGVTLQTAPGAQITAPFHGFVAYAEPLLNYRRLLILDVGDGYYIVMIGLGEVHVRTGQTVAAGEPVGEMPRQNRPGAAPEDRELYMEIRRHDEPVNPAPWLGTGWTS